MPEIELQNEIAAGVVFWGEEIDDALQGIMGLQDVDDVSLIRHAYVRPNQQRLGIGSRLLDFVRELTKRPILIGTWAGATWAHDFYIRHGFQLVGTMQKEKLLRRYWTVPEDQIRDSVVLVDSRFREQTTLKE